MATALQSVPHDHRPPTLNDSPMRLVAANVHTMSGFTQGLSYTEFPLNNSLYQTPKANHTPRAVPNGDFQQKLANYDLTPLAPATYDDTRTKEHTAVAQPLQPSVQQPAVQPTSSSPAPQDPNPQANVVHVDSLRESGPLQDSGSALQVEQSSSFQPPSGMPLARDYTTIRQSADLNNYYPQPQVNGYLPQQTRPSTSPSTIPIPVSPNPRAYALQPTYITPPPGATNPVSMKPQAPKEEVCLECAMRDQDMADVDVTSMGAWDRESDVFYADLLHREQEAQLMGTPLPDDPNRPNATGDMLSEMNLKIHLTMHPREPASRHRNLETYVKAQRLLLEAETLAHARAMHESRQLESKMRDTYSQLRRSAYETGHATAHGEDPGGVRIKTSRSASVPSGSPGITMQTQSREVTLLENGMIMEHVNVKREEKEERERRRKEEKEDRGRGRKCSAVDVTSVYSTVNPVQQTDTLGLKASARYSQSSLRPNSLLSGYGDRSPAAPRAYSTASFSDLHSIASVTSPNRRTRFFGLKSLSNGWRSRDSLAASGISGSMMDMHVALQQEQSQSLAYPQQTVDIGSNAPTLRMGESWPQVTESQQQTGEGLSVDDKSRKKTGLAKIWGIVTRSSKSDIRPRKGPSPVVTKSEDDYPLAPPPPLSYLVDRERRISSRRHLSTPSLPSTTVAYQTSASPQPVSPPTAPSSFLPTPPSSRLEGGDHRMTGVCDSDNHEQQVVDEGLKSKPMPNPVLTQNPTPLDSLTPQPRKRDPGRDKSLPPIPTESSIRFPSDVRPQTMFALDQRQDGDLMPPHPPFQSMDLRRQSFGGLEARPGTQNLTYPGPPGPVAAMYNEFGTSLEWWEDARRTQKREVASVETTPAASKRRSKFGLSSLFGRKDKGHALKSFDHEPTLYNTQSSEHEAKGFAAAGVRMSVTSRKAIQELVDQDPDFVAYRYPSNDERLDVFR